MFKFITPFNAHYSVISALVKKNTDLFKNLFWNVKKSVSMYQYKKKYLF